MSAVAGFPSLSQLVAWPTEHVTEAADHWEAVAARSYGLAHQVWREAISIDWQGDAAEALRLLVGGDHRGRLNGAVSAPELIGAAGTPWPDPRSRVPSS